MRYLLHDVFIDSVKRYPGNIAITTESGVHITYQQLNELSNKFANYFLSHKKSVLERPFVGILSTVTPSSVAAILGALKIGCAYVPLDEYSPTERLSKILDNTGLDIIVLESHWYEDHKDLLTHSGLKKVVLCDHGMTGTDIDVFDVILGSSGEEPAYLNQVSDDLAYILHSSGSTGIPKGIMLDHKNGRTFVDWMQKEFRLTENDVVMSRAPFKFDLSVFDIFNTLNAGARLVCFDWLKERPQDQKHADYVALMSKEKATMLYTTPSTFIALLNKGGLADHSLSLRTIMYAGEPFPPAQLRKVMMALPNTRVANIYGPTETNIITYYWIDKLPADDEAIPLGHVVDDTEIFVVSEDGARICEIDELGELWCRGGTVTLGYLGLDEKTRESYVRSPFHKYPAYYWRTGDFGFKDANGLLHYRGRKDHMVKVKGFRIELGEIENALAQYPALDEFAVVAIPDEKYGNRLHCYYAVLKGKTAEEEALKAFLRLKIPDYMIPYAFQQMELLPKTSSGKIDRVALAEASKD